MLVSGRAQPQNWLAAGAGRWSLARQLFALQAVIIAAVVLAGATLAWYDAQRQNEQAARQQVSAVAIALAVGPDVRNALQAAEPSARLQPLAESVRVRTGIGFVTIMNPAGVRYTHPNPDRIGERFVGHFRPALTGDRFTERYTGTLGPSVRAVVPVLAPDGQVVALISVGITVRKLTAELREQLVGLVVVAASALVLGGVGTYLVNARLRRHTYGMRPAELSRMYEYYDAILHAVREGLLLVSPSGVVTLCNDGAKVLLGGCSPATGKPAAGVSGTGGIGSDGARTDGAVTTGIEGVHVSDLGWPRSLVDAVLSEGTEGDEVHLTEQRVLLVNVSRVRSAGRDLGRVVTLRDHTELQALTGELDSLRGFSESLRAQAHEAANRLHTVISLLELGRRDEAIAFATQELELAQRLTDRVVESVTEPVLAAVLLGKSAEARERGVDIVLTPDTEVDDRMLERVHSRDLVTIVGNLIDNAVEAVREEAPAGGAVVTVRARRETEQLLLQVSDNGPGLEATPDVFQSGWSTRDGSRGLGLALVAQSVRRYAGTIEVSDEAGAVFTVRLPMSPSLSEDSA